MLLNGPASCDPPTAANASPEQIADHHAGCTALPMQFRKVLLQARRPMLLLHLADRSKQISQKQGGPLSSTLAHAHQNRPAQQP